MPKMVAVLLLFQAVWLSVLKMWRRSMSSNETGKNLPPANSGTSVSPAVASFVSNRSSTPISWPRQRTTARSTTFFNSRTLPGQRYFNNCLLRRGGEAPDLPPGLGIELLQEVVGQQGDVFLPFPQGGHDDLQHAEAEVEVAAEAPLGHVAFQVAVGGGDHPHVDLDRLAAADALEGMPFQHAEELGLDAGAHLADLVEHERALVGGLELADLPLGGAGEGAALVAEQFAGQAVRPTAPRS